MIMKQTSPLIIILFQLMELPVAKRDPKQEILQLYGNDMRESKMLLSSGSICDKKGNVFVIDSVVEAEKRVIQKTLHRLDDDRSSEIRKSATDRFYSSKSYLPLDGSETFLQLVSDLIWNSSNSPKIQSIQSPGGTAAIRMAADTIRRIIHETNSVTSTVWVSNPTWGNHLSIFQASGYAVNKYNYQESSCAPDTVDFELIMASLTNAQKYDVVMFQANCHNPTGLDLNEEQWLQLFTYCQDNWLILLIDMAFVGMANGIDEDFKPFQHLASKRDINVPWFFAVSYSKCFTMYNERVGSLSVICETESMSVNIKSHLKFSARSCYSNPPAHGAEIISTLLSDKELIKQWKSEIRQIGEDIRSRRDLFVATMKKYLPEHKGFTGGERKTIFMDICLTKEQNQYLRDTFALYNWAHHFNIMTVDESNMDHVCSCIAESISAIN